LLALRAEVLLQAGFVVSGPPTKNETTAELQQNPFDVFVVCHTWSKTDIEEMAQIYKRNNPGGCIIAVLETPWSACPPVADAVVSGVEGPNALLSKIRECMRSKAA
jgi:hypothetical protein